MGTFKMKPYACLLLFAISLSVSVSTHEGTATHAPYSTEEELEEARYQSNMIFLNNFLQEYRAGWPNGFPTELFRSPWKHWDFWLRINETLNQVIERSDDIDINGANKDE